eukprot:362362-Chlamydomonas_euryale.AAC.5
MYAGNLALLFLLPSRNTTSPDSPDSLEVLLGAVDVVAAKHGLFVNAAKTQIMVIGRPMALPTCKLSGKELLVADSFKYLGSFFADDGSTSSDMDVRSVRALATFCHFQVIWASCKLSYKQNMNALHSDLGFILLILSYSCEMWTCTEVRMGRRDDTRSNCLRRIVRVKLLDRHRL